MIDLAIDKTTHDLYIESDDLQLVNNIDQVEQSLKIRLLFFRDEWFLDTTSGIPYYTDVLVKNPNIPNIDSIIKATIADTPEVEELLEFRSEFNRSARTYTVIFKVRTTYGETEIQASLFS
jgi:GTPase SAR1 family protein